MANLYEIDFDRVKGNVTMSTWLTTLFNTGIIKQRYHDCCEMDNELCIRKVKAREDPDFEMWNGEEGND